MKNNKELTVVEILKRDRANVIKKMERALDEDNIGTYNNLTKSLLLISDLINKEDLKWVQMWTKYRNEHEELELAVWEQCGEDIRNHRRFLVYKEIKDSDNIAYFEADKDSTTFYYENKVHRVVGTFNEVVSHIDKNVFMKDTSIKIYGDTRGFGMGVCDVLIRKGYKILNTELNVTNFKVGINNSMTTTIEDR